MHWQCLSDRQAWQLLRKSETLIEKLLYITEKNEEEKKTTLLFCRYLQWYFIHIFSRPDHSIQFNSVYHLTKRKESIADDDKKKKKRKKTTTKERHSVFNLLIWRKHLILHAKREKLLRSIIHICDKLHVFMKYRSFCQRICILQHFLVSFLLGKYVSTAKNSFQMGASTWIWFWFTIVILRKIFRI